MPDLFKPLDADSLFWALSTLPQVSAALVAFIGFLVQDSLAKMDNRCRILEDFVLGLSEFKSLPVNLTKNDPTGIGKKSMKPEKLLKEIQAAFSDPLFAKEWGTGAKSSLDIWEPLNNWREETRDYLRWFLLWNVLVLGVSLALLPFSGFLAGLGSIVGMVWILISLSVAASAGAMIYSVFIRPQP